MTENIVYYCDNCGLETTLTNAKFEIAPETFKPGYEYETKVEVYETVLCSKCYKNYQEKQQRSSYKEPDIDTSAFPANN